MLRQQSDSVLLPYPAAGMQDKLHCAVKIRVQVLPDRLQRYQEGIGREGVRLPAACGERTAWRHVCYGKHVILAFSCKAALLALSAPAAMVRFLSLA